MQTTITEYLEQDHRRLEHALDRATAVEGTIEPSAYGEFRSGLLRHIGMEEKILVPAARSALHGMLLPEFEQMHLDHGALAALLVPTPTPAIVDAIRAILERHNALEEGAHGVYRKCEALQDFDSPQVLARLEAAPPVAMAPHVDNSTALDSMRAALNRAGYQFDL